MIITLKNADFSKSNIGMLSTWSIVRSLGAGTKYAGPIYVNKDSAFNAAVILNDGYEVGAAGVTVTMGGVTLDESHYSIADNVITITIAAVTGNVSIKVPTLNTATGEEDDGGDVTGGVEAGVLIDVSTRTTSNSYAQALPRGTTSTTNLWNRLTPEAMYYDSTGSYVAYQTVGSIVFPVLPGDKVTSSSYKERTGGIRVTYLMDDTIVKSMSPAEVVSETTSTGYLTIPTGVNAICMPVWDFSATGHEVYLFPAGAEGTPKLPANADNGGSNSGGDTEPSTPTPDDGTIWYVDHRDGGAKFTQSVNIAGRGWAHVPGTAAYNAYVGKPVNTIGFFTDKASQSVVVGKVAEKGGVDAMTTIATVTAINPNGATKSFTTITFPEVTLAEGECLCAFAQNDDDINFYYSSSSVVTDANGIDDNNFYGRVPKVYGSGTAWTDYPSMNMSLGWSIGYKAE